jgi:BlaI family transcriptional regulator, penicillinase repressor
MKTLTKAEEQVMQILWKLKEGIVKDVVDKFDDPKPAYTTVATVLKVLENKGFVSCRKIGNINLFSPAIGKKDYAKTQLSSFLKDYFSGSFPKLATFFARENNLSIDELEDMIRIAQNELKKEK